MRGALLVVVVAVAACKAEQTPPPVRCTVRVSADGVWVNGSVRTRDEAIAACRRTSGATVIVEAGAPPERWDELRAGLQAAGVKLYLRGTLWDGRCDPTSHAKGCPPP